MGNDVGEPQGDEEISLVDGDEGGTTSDAAAPRDRWAMVAMCAVASFTTALSAHMRLGYSYGFGDQAVLMVKGISIADHTAYVNDWFNDSSPQPHWSFDLVTAFGQKIHALPAVYLVYFLASAIVFGTASVLLARRWLPRRAWWLSILIGPLVVLGPISPLGSTTPILPIAIPHVLGGCLAYLAIVLILIDRPIGASIATVLTALVHVQHGANLAVVVIVCAVIWKGPTVRERWIMAAAGVAAGVHAYVATTLRGITGNGTDFIEVCQLRSPHHCNANTWPTARLNFGWLLVVMIALLIWSRRKHEFRRLLAVTALPLVGLLIGVWADRMDFPVIGELAQSTNVYRLVTLILPFAIWGLIVGIADADTVDKRGPMALFATLILLGWYSSYTAIADSVSGETNMLGATLMVLVVLTVALLVSALWTEWKPNYVAIGSAVALVGVCLGSSLPIRLATAPIGYSTTDPRVFGAQQVTEATPVGSVVAAPPIMTWLRAVSKRAVVVDCKSVPYGGVPWQQYKERMESLGGWDNCRGNNTYWLLTLTDIQNLADKYGVTHMLTVEGDPKYTQAADAGWELVAEFKSWLGSDGFTPTIEPPQLSMRLYKVDTSPKHKALGD